LPPVNVPGLNHKPLSNRRNLWVCCLILACAELPLDTCLPDPPIGELFADSIVARNAISIQPIAVMVQQAVTRCEHATRKPVSLVLEFSWIVTQEQ
ncbi:MAG: hypothetical protein AAGK02_13005, partial [Pseudomonadota bacterium]